jgi:hypothetical protein
MPSRVNQQQPTNGCCKILYQVLQHKDGVVLQLLPVVTLSRAGVLQENWETGRFVVKGCGGRFPSEGAELFLGNAGTAMRCVLCTLRHTMPCCAGLASRHMPAAG